MRPHVRFFRFVGYSNEWHWNREPLRTGVSSLYLGRFGIHYWLGR